MLQRILVCVLICCFMVFVASLPAQAQVYITGPYGNTITLDSPIHWHTGPHYDYGLAPLYVSPPAYVEPPVYVAPRTYYWHPGHWYRSEMTEWEWVWACGHWGTQPYRY